MTRYPIEGTPLIGEANGHVLERSVPPWHCGRAGLAQTKGGCGGEGMLESPRLVSASIRSSLSVEPSGQHPPEMQLMITYLIKYVPGPWREAVHPNSLHLAVGGPSPTHDRRQCRRARGLAVVMARNSKWATPSNALGSGSGERAWARAYVLGFGVHAGPAQNTLRDGMPPQRFGEYGGMPRKGLVESPIGRD